MSLDALRKKTESTTTIIKRRSWRTTAAGLLLGAAIIARKNPAWAPYATVAEAFAATLLGLVASDARKQ